MSGALIAASAAFGLGEYSEPSKPQRVRRLTDDEIDNEAKALGAAIYDTGATLAREQRWFLSNRKGFEQDSAERIARAKTKRERKNAKRLAALTQARAA